MELRHARTVLLAVAVITQLGVRPVLATHAPPVVVGVESRALLVGPQQACANVPETFIAGIMNVFEFDDGHRRYTSVMGNQQGILNVEAAGATSTVQASPAALTQFDLTFPNPGSFDVKAWGYFTGGGASDPVSPRTIHVDVKPCDYEIQQMSIWYHLPEGFKPWVGGLVERIRFRLTQVGSIVQSDNPLRTFAIGTFTCPVSFDVKDVTANVQAGLTTADNLHYIIAYTTGTATVTVSCDTPGGPIGSTSKPAPFQLDGIEGDVPAGPVCVLTCLWTYSGPIVSRRFPHVLHQTSDANGLTYVIVELKP